MNVIIRAFLLFVFLFSGSGSQPNRLQFIDVSEEEMCDGYFTEEEKDVREVIKPNVHSFEILSSRWIPGNLGATIVDLVVSNPFLLIDAIKTRTEPVNSYYSGFAFNLEDEYETLLLDKTYDKLTNVKVTYMSCDDFFDLTGCKDTGQKEVELGIHDYHTFSMNYTISDLLGIGSGTLGTMLFGNDQDLSSHNSTFPTLGLTKDIRFGNPKFSDSDNPGEYNLNPDFLGKDFAEISDTIGNKHWSPRIALKSTDAHRSNPTKLKDYMFYILMPYEMHSGYGETIVELTFDFKKTIKTCHLVGNPTANTDNPLAAFFQDALKQISSFFSFFSGILPWIILIVAIILCLIFCPYVLKILLMIFSLPIKFILFIFRKINENMIKRKKRQDKTRKKYQKIERRK